MKISEKTVCSLNARCRNDFCYDIRSLLERNEKQFYRVITLTENRKKIELSLYWTEEVICRADKYGGRISEYTGNVIPKLHCTVWDKNEGDSFWHSYGLGEFYTFAGHSSPKRLMNALSDATALVTDELILSLLPEREQAQCRQKLTLTDTTE